MLRLALLGSCQLLVALLAQALASLLAAHLSEDSALPLSEHEAHALRYASAPHVTPIACVAALLRLHEPLRRCALEATDGAVRSLAARCDWSAQLALLAEPSSASCLSLAIANRTELHRTSKVAPLPATLPSGANADRSKATIPAPDRA